MNEAIETRTLLAIIIAGIFSTAAIRGQDAVSPGQTQGQPGRTIEEVIVTGSNIPTSEEVGPNPIDDYRRDDLTRLGVRTATDLIQKLPEAMGASVTENTVNGGDGRAHGLGQLLNEIGGCAHSEAGE